MKPIGELDHRELEAEVARKYLGWVVKCIGESYYRMVRSSGDRPRLKRPARAAPGVLEGPGGCRAAR